MTHPGVGPITALATDVFLGDPKRFRDGKAVASYIGIIPRENSSAGRQRLGGLTKQGNPLLRFLWCEAAAHAVRRDPELRRFYRRKLVQKGLGKARVAAARKRVGDAAVLDRRRVDPDRHARSRRFRVLLDHGYVHGAIDEGLRSSGRTPQRDEKSGENQ